MSVRVLSRVASQWKLVLDLLSLLQPVFFYIVDHVHR